MEPYLVAMCMLQENVVQLCVKWFNFLVSQEPLENHKRQVLNGNRKPLCSKHNEIVAIYTTTATQHQGDVDRCSRTVVFHTNIRYPKTTCRVASPSLYSYTPPALPYMAFCAMWVLCACASSVYQVLVLLPLLHTTRNKGILVEWKVHIHTHIQGAEIMQLYKWDVFC